PAATDGRGAGAGRRPVTLIRRSEEPGQPLDLNLASGGNRLLIGLATAEGGSFEVWQWAGDGSEPQRSGLLQSPAAVVACALGDAMGSEVWFGSGSEIHVHAVDAAGKVAAEPVQRLATSVRAVQQVAFVDSAQRYELSVDYGMGWEDTF